MEETDRSMFGKNNPSRFWQKREHRLRDKLGCDYSSKRQQEAEIGALESLEKAKEPYTWIKTKRKMFNKYHISTTMKCSGRLIERGLKGFWIWPPRDHHLVYRE